MGKETLTEHKKHAALKKPDYGTFAVNEWAIIGAPCDKIKNLVSQLFNVSGGEASIFYMDESHNHGAAERSLSGAVKQGEIISSNTNSDWGKNQTRSLVSDYDFCLINGNHFTGKRQLVILDPKKEESLSRKLERLTNVRAFITTDEVSEPYDFIKAQVENWKEIPSFHISDTEAIWSFLKDDFKIPVLKALVLAGGKSSRMGHDKGKINYHGNEQRIHMYNLLGELVEEVFLSIRDEQEEEISDFASISDKFLGLGPFGAIASAFQEDPDAAWLVVPCDLPLLGEEELEKLIMHRNPFKNGTAYLNNETGFPEPLISIWEPKMYKQMLHFLTQGFSCPRKVLINSDVELIQVEDQTFMTNVNTPEELEKVQANITPS